MNVSAKHSEKLVSEKWSSVDSISPEASTSTSASHADVVVDSITSVVEVDNSLGENRNTVEIVEVENLPSSMIDLTTLLHKKIDSKEEQNCCFTKVVSKQKPAIIEYRFGYRGRSASDTIKSTMSVRKKCLTQLESVDTNISGSSRKRQSSGKSVLDKRKYSDVCYDLTSDSLKSESCFSGDSAPDYNPWSIPPSAKSTFACTSLTDFPSLSESVSANVKKTGGSSLTDMYKNPLYSQYTLTSRVNLNQTVTYSESLAQSSKRMRSSPFDDSAEIVDLRLYRSTSSSSGSSSMDSHEQKKLMKISRHWEWSNFGLLYREQPTQHQGLEFSIMSYNILAQDLLETHPYLYTHCDWDILLWEYRRNCLIKEIDKHSPDIMCLQEVQQDHYYDFLKPEFEKRGYEGVFCQKSNDQSDGCATFYKTLLFIQICSRCVDYFQGGVLDRGNVGLIVGLKPRNPAFQEDDNHLYVANTHLLFNPRRGDVKLAQLILLLAELEKIALKSHGCNESNVYHPFIMCGDFNTEPFSNIYDFIVSSFLHYEDLLIYEMSGQSQGQFGRDNYLSKDFFPSHLNINDHCQYINVFKERNQGKASEQIKEIAERLSNSPGKYVSLYNNQTSESVTNIDLSSNQSATTCVSPSELTLPLETGMLHHHFNLVSAYKHVTKVNRHRKVEVTTYHSRSCSTVDYIFYTVDKRSLHIRKNRYYNSQITERRLKLLCRYGLPSKKEAMELGGLPNEHLGSDHFSLLACFLLI